MIENDSEQDRIVLNLLNSVEQDGARSQRHFAAELGIALGLVNAYLNRCIKKGLVKVGQAPAKRFAYYLTPQGFSEKSRLTVEYLSSSFGFFRRAKADCATVFEAAHNRRLKKLVLIGVSDLAEIAAICALESDVQLAAVIDPAFQGDRFVGLPVLTSWKNVDPDVDGAILTALTSNLKLDLVVEAATECLGAASVLTPKLLAGQQSALPQERAS
jgi:Winged helix-turn-helix DNA-binding